MLRFPCQGSCTGYWWERSGPVSENGNDTLPYEINFPCVAWPKSGDSKQQFNLFGEFYIFNWSGFNCSGWHD